MSLYDPPAEPWLVRLLATPCTCGATGLRHKDTCAIVKAWKR